MESRTGTQLIAAVRFGADMQGLELRHPDADVLREINTSIRSLRGLCTSNGFPYFLDETSAVTLVGTQVTGETYSEVPWPDTAEDILGVDVASSETSEDWESLDPITWGQRRGCRYHPAPSFFCIKSVPRGSGADVQDGVIALFPAATSGVYKISYLPHFVDLEADHVFLGRPDWHVWVIADAQQVLIGRDDDVQETYAIVTRKKAEAEARILDGLGKAQSAGPLRPRRRPRRFGRRW